MVLIKSSKVVFYIGVSTFLLAVFTPKTFGSVLREEYATSTIYPEISNDEGAGTTLRGNLRVRREASDDSTTNVPYQDAGAVTGDSLNEILYDTTVISRSKREAVTEIDATQSDDLVDSTTLVSRVKRDVTESTLSDGLIEETTTHLRSKREAVEIVTESISSNEILLDELEKVTTALPLTFEKSFDSVDIIDEEENFKYPTTPYPYPLENITSPDFSQNHFPSEIVKDINEQKFIMGNRSCQCGTVKTKIVGGEEASISELPWTVALVRKRNTTEIRQGPYCGATLVNSRYVVTASHCVDGFEAEKIEVWVNEEDFRVEDENMSGTIRVNVEEIIMHPSYDRKKIDNDIALLRLSEPINIDGPITPVCIPADNSNTFENEEGIVAGWGAKEQGGKVSATLQKVSVPILTNTVCNWRSLYLGRITDNQLCAGELASGGKDSCQGDSGGPLIVRSKNSQSMLVGVVSYGFGCARPLAPGVYTRVSRYPEWIAENSKDAEYCGGTQT